MRSYTDIRDAIIHGHARCDHTRTCEIWSYTGMRNVIIHGHLRCDHTRTCEMWSYTGTRDAIIHGHPRCDHTRTCEIWSYTGMRDVIIHGHPRCDHTRTCEMWSYTDIRDVIKHGHARCDHTRTCEMWSYTDTALHVQYLLFLSDFKETWIFLTNFLKILKYQILWKSIQWEPSCSLRSDGRTDTTKLKFASCSFPNALKNWWCLTIWPVTFLCWLCFGYGNSIHQANVDGFFQIWRRYKIALLSLYQKLLLRRENWMRKEITERMR